MVPLCVPNYVPMYAGLSHARVAPPPQFLADQLTLSQPGGHITTCPPGFSDLATALVCPTMTPSTCAYDLIHSGFKGTLIDLLKM